MSNCLVNFIYFCAWICTVNAKYAVMVDSNTNIDNNFGGANINSQSYVDLYDASGRNINQFADANVQGNSNVGLSLFSKMNYQDNGNSNPHLVANSGLDVTGNKDTLVNARSGLKVKPPTCNCFKEPLSAQCRRQCELMMSK